MRVPERAGFYWAKSFNFTWYNLLVRVTGEVPFLVIGEFIDRSGRYTELHLSNIVEWGPRIPYPEDDPDEA